MRDMDAWRQRERMKESMKLDEAIEHCEEVADRCAVTDGSQKCEAEHRQLAKWLRELKERRSSARGNNKKELTAEVRRMGTVGREDAIASVKTGTFAASLLYGQSDALKTALEESVQIIIGLPPREPERKRGKWVKMSDSFGTYYACNCCGEDCTPHGMKTPFCPSCGAEMSEGEQT